MYNQNKAGEMPILIEGEHFEIVKNKAGYPYKYAILDHICWCPKEGIVEIKTLKNNLTTTGGAKNDQEIIIKRFKDRETDLLFGIHSGVDDRTGDINHKYVRLVGNMQFDLSIPNDRKEYIIAMRGPSVEGSPNQTGKPAYKLFDKQIIASKNIDTRKLKRKAEDIIESMKHTQLEEMALNIGVNVNANKNPQMLLDEVYRVMESNPKKFIEIYENKDREIISIYHKAKSLGIITQDFLTQTYSFGGIPLGVGEQASIEFLIEKRQMAYVIKQQCEVTDKGTAKSMAFADKPEDIEKKALLARIAELEALNKSKTDSADEHKDTVTEDHEMIELRKEAEELGVKGYALPSIKKETLKAKVEEAKTKLA